MNNEALICAFIQQVWNEKNFDSVALFVAPAYSVYLDNADPWEGKILDHEAFITRLKYSFDSFPDMHFDIRTIITDGDLVAMVWVMTGTNTGNIGGFPPTHKKIEAEGITLYQCKDAKVCGHTQVYDRTTIMKQLGFVA